MWRKLSVRRLGPSDLLHTDVLHYAQLSICNTHRSARDETKRSAARPSLTATQRLPDSLLILLRALGRITAVITAIHLFFGRDGTYTSNVQNSCRDGTINTANYYQNQFFIHENMIFDQYGVQTFELPTVCGKSCYCCGNPHALIQAREVIDLAASHTVNSPSSGGRCSVSHVISCTALPTCSVDTVNAVGNSCGNGWLACLNNTSIRTLNVL